jgi:hypothetical protein
MLFLFQYPLADMGAWDRLVALDSTLNGGTSITVHRRYGIDDRVMPTGERIPELSAQVSVGARHSIPRLEHVSIGLA